jgi:hypothetical protein
MVFDEAEGVGGGERRNAYSYNHRGGRSMYDIAPDDNGFLFISRVAETRSAPITVVVNWDRN